MGNFILLSEFLPQDYLEEVTERYVVCLRRQPKPPAAKYFSSEVFVFEYESFSQHTISFLDHYTAIMVKTYNSRNLQNCREF